MKRKCRGLRLHHPDPSSCQITKPNITQTSTVPITLDPFPLKCALQHVTISPTARPDFRNHFNLHMSVHKTRRLWRWQRSILLANSKRTAQHSSGTILNISPVLNIFFISSYDIFMLRFTQMRKTWAHYRTLSDTQASGGNGNGKVTSEL